MYTVLVQQRPGLHLYRTSFCRRFPRCTFRSRVVPISHASGMELDIATVDEGKGFPAPEFSRDPIDQEGGYERRGIERAPGNS